MQQQQQNQHGSSPFVKLFLLNYKNYHGNNTFSELQTATPSPDNNIYVPSDGYVFIGKHIMINVIRKSVIYIRMFNPGTHHVAQSKPLSVIKLDDSYYIYLANRHFLSHFDQKSYYNVVMITDDTTYISYPFLFMHRQYRELNSSEISSEISSDTVEIIRQEINVVDNISSNTVNFITSFVIPTSPLCMPTPLISLYNQYGNDFQILISLPDLKLIPKDSYRRHKVTQNHQLELLTPHNIIIKYYDSSNINRHTIRFDNQTRIIFRDLPRCYAIENAFTNRKPITSTKYYIIIYKDVVVTLSSRTRMIIIPITSRIVI